MITFAISDSAKQNTKTGELINKFASEVDVIAYICANNNRIDAKIFNTFIISPCDLFSTHKSVIVRV